MLAPWKKSYDQPRQHIKKQRYYFAYKGPYSQSYMDVREGEGFSSSHVRMWELGNGEGWAPKNWCLPNVVLEKTLKSPLDCKEIKPVNPKGNQPWISLERTDAETEAPILWPLIKRPTHWKRLLMLGKIEGKRRRGWQRMRWLDGITHWMDIVWTSSGSWLMDREAWCDTVPWIAKSWTQLSYWTELRQLDLWHWSLDNLKL